jgi:hypothetical protein
MTLVGVACGRSPGRVLAVSAAPSVTAEDGGATSPVPGGTGEDDRESLMLSTPRPFLPKSELP